MKLISEIFDGRKEWLQPVMLDIQIGTTNSDLCGVSLDPNRYNQHKKYTLQRAVVQFKAINEHDGRSWNDHIFQAIYDFTTKNDIYENAVKIVATSMRGDYTGTLEIECYRSKND